MLIFTLFACLLCCICMFVVFVLQEKRKTGGLLWRTPCNGNGPCISQLFCSAMVDLLCLVGFGLVCLPVYDVEEFGMEG